MSKSIYTVTMLITMQVKAGDELVAERIALRKAQKKGLDVVAVVKAEKEGE